MQAIKTKSKSKGKSKSVQLKSIAQQSQTNIRDKRLNQSINQKFIQKNITISYSNAKVHFNLKKIDEFLMRTLIHAFYVSNPELKKFTILTNLQIIKKHSEENSYTHTIDSKEAMSLITHLLQKQKGKIRQIDQIHELKEIVQTYAFKDEDEDLESEERKQFNRQVQRTRHALNKLYHKLKKQTRESFQGSEDQFIMKAQERRIRQLAVQLFNLNVVALRQTSNSQVDLIYEQSYPQKQTNSEFLKQIIGDKLYLEKVVAFAKLFGQAKKAKVSNSNFIICHMCKQLILNEYIRCSNYNTNQFVPTYNNSPNTYYRHLIAYDYCYKYENSLTKEQLSQELQYFVYHKVGLGYNCLRFFCGSCINNYIYFNRFESVKKFICPFCNFTCACKSCLKESDKPFKKNMSHYEELTKEMLKTSKIMNKYHQLYIKSPALYFKKKQQITPRMRAMMKCWNQMRLPLKYQLNNAGKSLRKVKEQILNYQIQQKEEKIKRKAIQFNKQKQKEFYRSTSIEKQSKKRVEPETIAAKLSKYSEQLIINNRFRVPLQKQLQLQRITFLPNQKQKIVQELKLKLTKFDPQNSKKCIHFKTMIPYDEVDYQKFFNLPKRSKLHDYESYIEDSNIKNHIYYEMHDPFRGAIGNINYRKYFDTFQEYINGKAGNDGEQESFEEQRIDPNFQLQNQMNSEFQTSQLKSKNNNSDISEEEFSSDSGSQGFIGYEAESVGSSYFLGESINNEQSMQQQSYNQEQDISSIKNSEIEKRQSNQFNSDLISENSSIDKKQIKQDDQNMVQKVSIPELEEHIKVNGEEQKQVMHDIEQLSEEHSSRMIALLRKQEAGWFSQRMNQPD